MFKSIAAAGKPLGREHWLMVGAIRLTFPAKIVDKVLSLRSAWAALRLRHPDIAILLHDTEKRYEPLTSPEALETWVSSTFHVETSAQSADELFSRHLKVTADSATCHWVVASDELVIVSAHWRWDGRGLLLMLHEFLSLLAGPDNRIAELQPQLQQSQSQSQSHHLGSEASNLAPSIDAVINVPDPLRPEWLTRANELLAPFIEGPPSIGLPITTGSLPSDTLRVETVVSSEVTSALRAACRTRGIKLTAALHASLITEVAKHQHRPSDDETAKHFYKSWAAFDLRKYCPAPDHAPSLRMVALPLVADAAADWETLAKRVLQPVYAQSFALEDSDLMFVRVPYVQQATQMLASAAAPTTEPNLSNLGALDEYVHARYGEVEVRDVWLGVHMLSPQLYVHTWSWKGCLHISICYNEAFYEADFVRDWLEKLKVNLLTNLGVTVDSSVEV